MLLPEPARRVTDPPTAAIALVVAAHPDDVESWCAGTLARMVRAGTAVDYLLVTSGEKGIDDAALGPAEVAAMREAEQIEAARRLGARSVRFLRYPDGEFEDTRALRGEIVRYLRRLRPDVVFTHDPERPFPPYTTHRDHRVVGRAVLDAAYPLARDRLAFPEQAAEGLAPHRVREAWLFSSAAPDTWVDVAETFDAKVDARLAHASQTRDAEALRAAWRERAAAVGAPVGLALAEAFVVLLLG